MEQFCFTLLTMSLTAALAALAVMLLRVLLYRLPRGSVALLWLAVFARMLCPLTLSLPVSPMPEGISNGTAAEYILFSAPGDLERREAGPSQALPDAVSDGEEDPIPAEVPASPWKTEPVLPPSSPPGNWPPIVFGVWAAGAAGCLLWSLVSYGRLRRRVREAVLVTENIYESDQIDSPFLCGLRRPRIYLPAGMEDPERKYVILHEQAHIHRCDHIVKPLAWLALCLHWFNPVLWCAFRLLCLDLETACDQRATRDFAKEDVAGYAEALLHLGRSRSLPLTVPLAFGEEDAKERVESVLHYRHPGLRVLGITAAVCLIACLLLAADRSGSLPGTLQGHPITEGYLICGGERIDLPLEMREELGQLLRRTEWTKIDTVQVKMLDEPELRLSPQASGLRLPLSGDEVVLRTRSGSTAYRLLLSDHTQPWLLRTAPKTRSGVSGMEVRVYHLNGSYGSYDHRMGENNIYARWTNWWREADALLPVPTAEEIYALAPGDPADLEADRILLDALGVREAVGDYALEYYERPGGGTDLILTLGDQLPASRQSVNHFLESRGLLFLALTEDLYALDWLHADGVGMRVDRSYLPYEGGKASPEIFAQLYPQRNLWWWHTLSLGLGVSIRGSLEVIAAPAWRADERLYINDLKGIDGSYSDVSAFSFAANEFILLPAYGHFQYSLNLWKGCTGHDYALAPLEDLSLSDPEYHPEDLLAGLDIQRGWQFYAPHNPLFAADEHELWAGNDLGFRLYEGPQGRYLAHWRRAYQEENSQNFTWYLEYLFHLEEKPVSTGALGYTQFFDDNSASPRWPDIDPNAEPADLP